MKQQHKTAPVWRVSEKWKQLARGDFSRSQIDGQALISNPGKLVAIDLTIQSMKATSEVLQSKIKAGSRTEPEPLFFGEPEPNLELFKFEIIEPEPNL